MDIYHIDLPSEILQSLDVYTGSPKKKKIQETEIHLPEPMGHHRPDQSLVDC